MHNEEARVAPEYRGAELKAGPLNMRNQAACLPGFLRGVLSWSSLQEEMELPTKHWRRFSTLNLEGLFNKCDNCPHWHRRAEMRRTLPSQSSETRSRAFTWLALGRLYNLSVSQFLPSWLVGAGWSPCPLDVRMRWCFLGMAWVRACLYWVLSGRAAPREHGKWRGASDSYPSWRQNTGQNHQKVNSRCLWRWGVWECYLPFLICLHFH